MGRRGNERTELRATLWLLARDAGVPVGVTTASVAEDRGWVDYLAVAASHRGRGIGPALLRCSFAVLADRDVRRVLVSVDAQNPTGATAVYERVGMRIVNSWDQWERPPAAIRGPPRSSGPGQQVASVGAPMTR